MKSKTLWLAASLCVACLFCSACPAAPAPEWTLVRNGKPAVEIFVPEKASPAIAMAARDLQAYVQEMTGAKLAIVSGVPAAPKRTAIIIAPGAQGKTSPETMTISTGSRGGVPVITLSGASDVGAMYATYRFLELLGVRFFHPEETYVPRKSDLSVGPLKVTESPVYKYRGIQQHTLHPIPATKFLMENTKPEDLQRSYRYVDWLARNRQNYLFWWWVERVKPQDRIDYVRKIVDYAHKRGVKVGMVVGMPFNQQNSYNLMRGEACHSDTAQWTGYLRQGVDEMAALGVDALCIFFGNTEMSTFRQPAGCDPVDAVQATVDRVEAVRDYCKEKYPRMELTLWVHPTAGMKGNEACPNYFLLPKLCSPDVGAAVHSVQFYNLIDPAPTYGNVNLNFLRDFAFQQAKLRPVWYWPESAYACGFDNDVPTFFPGYLTGRAKDAKLLAGEAVAHITFSTGIEWSYWLVDYAVARYGWNPSKWSADDVIDDFAGIFEPSVGRVVGGSLRDLAAANDQYLVNAAGANGYNLMLLLNAAHVGQLLDTLPGLTPEQLRAWREKYLPPLREFAARYAHAASALRAVQSEVGAAEKPWFDELLDSVEITQLRLEHQAMVADAFSRRVMNPKDSAATDMDKIARIEDQADALMSRRIQRYRYPSGGVEGDYFAVMRKIDQWNGLNKKIAQYASPADLYPEFRRSVLATPYRLNIVGELGKRVKATVEIPEDFPLDKPLKLCARLDDMDSPLEGAAEIAGTTIPLPETGDSKDRIARLDIPAGLLKPGANDIWFVFRDNVGGSTRGFYASAVCVAAQ